MTKLIVLMLLALVGCGAGEASESDLGPSRVRTSPLPSCGYVVAGSSCPNTELELACSTPMSNLDGDCATSPLSGLASVSCMAAPVLNGMPYCRQAAGDPLTWCCSATGQP